MDKEYTLTNRPEDKKIDGCAQGFISERWHREIGWVKEKKEEEDSPTMKIASMH